MTYLTPSELVMLREKRRRVAAGPPPPWTEYARPRKPLPQQLPFLRDQVKRKVIRAGRRGGKTVGIAIMAVEYMMQAKRVLYAAPTDDQVETFWNEVSIALQVPVDLGYLKKNETRHLIQLPYTNTRIRAKTAWDADSLRGDSADLLILDEFQLMHEDAWALVGAPMLLDRDGDAVFIYTPPSRMKLEKSRAKDPRHAAKLFKRASADESGRWKTYTFSSYDNPSLSEVALSDITKDMTDLAIRQEIMAIDEVDVPGALWTKAQIDELRWPPDTAVPPLSRIVVAVDPSATSTGDEAGIVVGGIGLCRCKGVPEQHAFILADESLQGGPEVWAGRAVSAFHDHNADAMVAESNNGGEMVQITIGTIEGAPYVQLLHASRGKQTRAEPVAVYYSKHKAVHHVGVFEELEDEQTGWVPGMASPNRFDALVWCLTELLQNSSTGFSMSYDKRGR